MIAVAMIDNKPEPVFDLRQLLDMIERDYGLDTQDFANLMEQYTIKPQEYPELQKIYDDIIEDNRNHTDGLHGDDFYIACEEIRNTQEEIRAEIDALRSNSRKGNTKADIARRLENIVSNMDGIL